MDKQIIQLNIKRFFTDLNGVVIDKAAVPVNFRKKFPYFLWGEMDFHGGFRNGLTSKTPVNGTFYLYSYIVGYGYNFLDYQFGNNVRENLRTGDLVHVYADNAVLPSIICLIVISSDDQAYTSVLDQSKGNVLNLEQIQFITDNEPNWQEIISFIESDNLGNYVDNQFSPQAFKNPYDYQANFINVPFTKNIDEKIGFASFLLFDTDLLQINFELLTQKFASNGNNIPTAQLFRIN